MGGSSASNWRRNARPLSSGSPVSSNTTSLTTLSNTYSSDVTFSLRTTPCLASSWRSTAPATSPLRQQPYRRPGLLATTSAPDLARNVPHTSSASASPDWRARSDSLLRELKCRSPAPFCLTSAPQEGDFIRLPLSVDSESIFMKHKQAGFYGEAENHPLVVLEVADDLVVCAQVTTFNGNFKTRCRSLAWATHFMPLGSNEHPMEGWNLNLTPGSTVTGYVNLETPLVIEWRVCEPFRAGNHSSALVPESRVRLLQQMARWDRPASAIQDPWKVRRWLHDELPDLDLVKLATCPLGPKPGSAPTSRADDCGPDRVSDSFPLIASNRPPFKLRPKSW